jgi:hypothetical protein
VQSIFRADDQGREAGLASNCFGSPLIKGKVPGGHGRCLGLFDSGKKGMNGIVPAFHSMIQMGKDRQLVQVSLNGKKSLGGGLNETGFLGEKMRGMKTKGIPDANQPFWGAVGQSETGSPLPFWQTERFQGGQGQGTHGSTQEHPTVHSKTFCILSSLRQTL